MATMPSEFFARMALLADALPHDPSGCGRVAAASLAIILLVPRCHPRVPGSIVALVAGHGRAWPRSHLPVETIGTQFGGIPGGLPHVRGAGSSAPT